MKKFYMPIGGVKEEWYYKNYEPSPNEIFFILLGSLEELSYTEIQNRIFEGNLRGDFSPVAKYDIVIHNGKLARYTP